MERLFELVVVFPAQSLFGLIEALAGDHSETFHFDHHFLHVVSKEFEAEVEDDFFEVFVCDGNVFEDVKVFVDGGVRIHEESFKPGILDQFDCLGKVLQAENSQSRAVRGVQKLLFKLLDFKR